MITDYGNNEIKIGDNIIFVMNAKIDEEGFLTGDYCVGRVVHGSGTSCMVATPGKRPLLKIDTKETYALQAKPCHDSGMGDY